MRTKAMSTARGRSEIFKSVFLIILVSQLIGSVAPLPQRGNVHFPSNNNQQPVRQPNNIFPTGNPAANGIVPAQNPVAPHNSNHPGAINNNYPVPVPSNRPTGEFQVGTTGIACDSPGNFVRAPDGCNRCFCAENRQLSSACSRVFCPPGFPSSSQGQYRL